jgi:hypothetical protein
VALWLLAALLLAGAARAQAELGGDMTTVAADQQQMQGTGRVLRIEGKYATAEYESGSGEIVREYVTADGTVFGVAWQGPTIPDLRRLLGNYYQEYERAAEAAGDLRHRGPLVIQQPGLVVQSGGHMRAYSGWAYLPELLPSGVRAEAIR